MELHERLSTCIERPRQRRPRPVRRGQEPDPPRASIAELGPQLFGRSRLRRRSRERVEADIREQLRQEPASRAPTASGSATEIADDILGHGPLERLLADDTVTEIMVNGPDDIWVERDGRLYETPLRFDDESHLRRIINKMVGQVGRRIDESSPMVDARLPDGCRVNAIIPPLSLSGPLAHDPQVRAEPASTLDDLIDIGTLSADGGRLPQRLRPGRAEHPHLGRYRHRQDDAPERALGGDARQRPDRHDRGRGRAAAPPAARASARVAPEEHRGRGRGRRSATSSATPCACGPTGSSSARSAAPRRSTCSRR